MNGLWNSQGFLPPIEPGYDGISEKRSPYQVSLSDLIELFSYTVERREILNGFLQYRKMLHRLGLKNGFQWINGSFMQNIEIQENRAPNDIDVVTFAYLPTGENQESFYLKNNKELNHNHIKASFKVDHYYFQLGRPLHPHHIKGLSYWYSLWSHNRNQIWKGFFEVRLDPEEDFLLKDKMCFDEMEG